MQGNDHRSGVAHYRLIFPQKSDLSRYGADAVKLIGIPIVISNDGRLESIITDFLIERSLGSWCGFSGTRLSANSILNLARDIVGFLNYCAALGVDWVSLERGDETKPASVIGYANAMDVGSWAFGRRSISSHTISRRTNAIQDVLSYAGSNGYRSPYEIRPIRGYGARKWTISRRIQLPERDQLNAWFQRIRVKDTRRNYLMSRMAFEMGLRREEIVCFRAAGIPSINEITANDFVYIPIWHGTKGGRSRVDESIVGKRRTIRVASSFAKQLYAFKNGPSQRLADLKVLKLNFPKAIEPKELFFNPHTNKRYTPGHLNNIFKRQNPPDVVGWSPHIGRHTYASLMLVELIEKSTSNSEMARSMSYEKFGAIADRAIEAVQGFLGHEKQDTTERYVRWAHAHLTGVGQNRD